MTEQDQTGRENSVKFMVDELKALGYVVFLPSHRKKRSAEKDGQKTLPLGLFRKKKA